jgi:hypothetical protein
MERAATAYDAHCGWLSVAPLSLPTIHRRRHTLGRARRALALARVKAAARAAALDVAAWCRLGAAPAEARLGRDGPV